MRSPDKALVGSNCKSARWTWTGPWPPWATLRAMTKSPGTRLPQRMRQTRARRPNSNGRLPSRRLADPPAEVEITDDRGDRLTMTAYRLAVFGVLFFPLAVISLIIVLIVAFGVNTQSPSATRRFYLALQIDLGLLGLWGMLLCGLSGSLRF